MSAEVLVVDDDTGAGRTFAKSIESRTRIGTVYTDEPNAAIQIVQQNSVKVAVLDQRMPKMKGTELVKKLKEIEPRLKVILISGQADLKDVQEAVGLFHRFLDKNNINELPELVRLAYEERMAELAEEGYSSLEISGEWHSGFSWRGDRVAIYFTFLEDPAKDGPHIWLDNEFKLVVRLESGQTQEVSHTITSETEVLTETELQFKSSVASEWSSKISNSTPLKVELANKIQATLESTVRSKLQGRRMNRTERVLRETFTLPAVNLDGTASSVRAREIQRAPIYLRKRALSRTVCACCGMEKYESFNVLIPTDEYRTRHIDYSSDGSKEIIEV